MSILTTELLAMYEALRSARPLPDLAPLPIQYADYATWQRARLNSGALEAQRAYWKHHLAGAPVLLELPTDFPRPPQPSGRGRVVSFEVPAEVVGGVRALAASCSATLFMVLLAAWQVITLQRYSMSAASPCMTLVLTAHHAKFGLVIHVPEPRPAALAYE